MKPSYYRTKAPQIKQETFTAELAWGAAVTAQRINGRYIKVDLPVGDGEEPLKTSRSIMLDALTHPEKITEQDIAQGIECRKTLANHSTLSALKGELSEWEQTVAGVCSKDTFQKMYDLSVLASLPNAYEKYLKREEAKQVLANCEHQAVGKVGESVKLTARVVSAGYSQKYDTWYVSTVTPDNRAVYFAYREAIAVDSEIEFSGKVKAFRDTITQLSRVKLVTKE
jgi:hypothetical protein